MQNVPASPFFFLFLFCEPGFSFESLAFCERGGVVLTLSPSLVPMHNRLKPLFETNPRVFRMTGDNDTGRPETGEKISLMTLTEMSSNQNRLERNIYKKTDLIVTCEAG